MPDRRDALLRAVAERLGTVPRPVVIAVVVVLTGFMVSGFVRTLS